MWNYTEVTPADKQICGNYLELSCCLKPSVPLKCTEDFLFLIYGLTLTKNQIIVKMEQIKLLINLARIYNLNDHIQIHFLFPVASCLTFIFPFERKRKKSSCFFQYGSRNVSFLLLLNSWECFTDEFYCLQTSENKQNLAEAK